MWNVVMWCCGVFTQVELNCSKRLKSHCLRKHWQKHARPCRNCANAVNWQVPCLGPAAVEAVNSVEVEVNSSEIPVSGGEFR